MRPIRVAHLNNLDIELKIHLGNYMLYQHQQGYDVSAVCHPGQWLKRDTTILDGIFTKIIPFEPRMSPLDDIKTLIRLIGYFRKEHFDIVHTHTPKPGLLGALAARITGVPIVVHTLHGAYLFPDYMSPVRYRFFAAIEKLICGLSDSILSQNKQDIDLFIREGVCPPEKISHLGNGIDLQRFYPGCVPPEKVAALRTQLGIPAQRPVVAIVARMVREKGFPDFVAGVSLLKAKGVEATYLAVGGRQKDKTTAVSPEDLLREYGVEDDIKLLGVREDMPELLSLIDLVILPSYAEGIPRILMEAAAMGKPVVATRVRGNIEAVVDGETGLLVPLADAAALADAIHSLLKDPQRRAAMGQQARQHALEHFDERLFFWKTDAEYRRLVATRLPIDPNRVLRPIPSRVAAEIV